MTFDLIQILVPHHGPADDVGTVGSFGETLVLVVESTPILSISDTTNFRLS